MAGMANPPTGRAAPASAVRMNPRHAGATGPVSYTGRPVGTNCHAGGGVFADQEVQRRADEEVQRSGYGLRWRCHADNTLTLLTIRISLLRFSSCGSFRLSSARSDAAAPHAAGNSPQ